MNSQNVPITTMSVPELQDLIKKTFVQNTANREMGDISKLYRKETVGWEVNQKRFDELDREKFAERKGELQASAVRGYSKGYSKTVERYTVSVERVLSGEAYKNVTALGLAEWATAVVNDVYDKIDLDMRNFLGYSTGAASYVDNGGYTVDLTTGDGLAVFNAAHTLKFSSTTYSNIVSGAPAFSAQALDQAYDFFSYNVYDNNGKRMSMKPNTVITSKKPAMMHRVKRILNSQSQEKVEGTTNANSGVMNTYSSLNLEHLAIEFDVDQYDNTNTNLSYYWFLACLGGDMASSLQFIFASWGSPEAGKVEVDESKFYLSWVARAFCGIAALSGRGIVVSKATA